MNFKDAVRKMHDDSGVSYNTASQRMGRAPQYISALLQNSGNPRLDTCAGVANAFDFRLIVRGDEIFYSIRRDDSEVLAEDEIPAEDAIRRITDACPQSNYAISKAMGKSTAYIASIISRGAMPTIETFVSIAEACGYEVIVKGHRKLYHLSKKAKFSASNRAKNTPSSGTSSARQPQRKVSRIKPALDEIDVFGAIAMMRDSSNISFGDASRKIGHRTNYIDGIYYDKRMPRADKFSHIASGFGFDLIAIGNSRQYSIKPNTRFARGDDEVSARFVLDKLIECSPLTERQVWTELGVDKRELIPADEETLAPKMDVLILVAATCGYQLLLKRGRTGIGLSAGIEGLDSDREMLGEGNSTSSPRSDGAQARLPGFDSWQQRSADLQALVDLLKEAEDSTERRRKWVQGQTGSAHDDISREYAELIGAKTREPQVTPAERKGTSDVYASAADPDSSEAQEGFGNRVAPSNPEPISVRPMAQTVEARQSISQERPMTREEQKLSDYKRRLLDLSMRNNLLNYRDKKTGTIHVLVPDMVATYRRLVLNERPMTFRESSPEDDERPKAGGDTTIVTERTRADLIRSLRRLDTVARSSIDEQGINILYLAFGMLRWVDDTQKEHVAPLVMAPVRLTRASARSSFILQTGDDDPVVNPTLAYFLEQTYKMTLPSFEKEDQLQRFLVSVADLVQGREGWSVSTDVVLSTFQFQKLSMYHDLEARSAEILEHPIVRAIMGDSSALGDVSELENPDSFKPTDTYQVVDADASQQAAILAAHAGESFVLQGPPGTGKSQTITNIIADCLGSGKKVLFVSEKKAALDVVHRRLTQSKLDDFCLVLHSNKAGKKEVLGQLDHTLSLYGTRPRMSAAAETRLDTMVNLRDELNGYADAIYTPIEPLGRSPYEIIGAVARYERDGVPWVSCRIDGIQYLTPRKVSQMADAARTYARELGRLGEKPERNPWNTFGISQLEYGESGEVLRTFSQVSRGARELMDIWSRLTTELEVDVSPTFDALEASVGLLDDLAKMPVVPLGVSGRPVDESRTLIIDWNLVHKDLVSSSDVTTEALVELARLDPTLDLGVEPARLSEVGYARGLAEELNRRLQGTAHYSAWQTASEADVDMVVSRLKERVNSYDRHKGTILADYHPELLDIDYIAMETRFKTEYQSFFKRMFGQHGEDIRTLASLRRSSAQVDDEEATRILALLHDLSNEERSLDERSGDYETLLGECYRGMRTDFDLIARRREALRKARECIDLLGKHESAAGRAEQVGRSASESFGYLFDTNDPNWTESAGKVIDSLEDLIAMDEMRPNGVNLGSVVPLLAESWLAATAKGFSDELKSSLRRRRPTFKKVDSRASGADLGRRVLDQLADAIDGATSAGATSLERSVSYTQARRDCVNLGLEGFLSAISVDERAMDQDFLDQYDLILRHTALRIWLGSVALVERPTLRDFSAREHERRVSRFTALDAEQLDIDQARVLTELFPRIPSPNVRSRGKDEISILLRELNKKSRIRPIRKLFADIPHAVLALKPCLMMSPLSVSTYLESATFQFDTVIFDEASQVRTEDALGVISRGKQVIIAGDSKQLPPTNFFAATVAEDDDEGDEEYYEQAGSFDSVLDEAALLNPISLKWHYRSRDESLITFSNEEIYDGDLFTFPSNRTSGRDSGVEYVYVRDGIYEGSRKGNPVEAARVAELVMSHFATYGTERSLGVIALGENQARVIENELLARRLANPESERFFDTGAEEAFFVKNLENVQGDERDTIILSVGYAKGANGRLSHNFGPINMEGGERRLNVAVTRARVNLKLVTSLDPSEIDANRVSNVGPRMLKDYLSYAKIGPSGEGGALLREYGYVDEDSFAEVIRDELVDSGYEVEERVGRSGCKVDLAVRHPEHRDCYCIGIVCDGDSYHAATTARDRDRLRTQVLLGMGWSLYHVWSRAWLQDPERQKDLLVAAVKSAIESFVPPVERVPVEAPIEEPAIDLEDNAEGIEAELSTMREETSEPEPARTEYLEVEHHIEEHRYGFQSYPEYKPPRRGAISDLDLLKQFIYAQAPFSVDYFLQRYREYCYAPGQRMNDAVRRSGIGYLQTKLRDTVTVRKEHGAEYVFRRDQRAIIPRVVGPRSIADISTAELREGALLVLKGYMGELDRKGLIEETSAAFEFPRRTNTIERRIGEAIDDLRLYGKVKVVDGFYVPADR